MGFGLFLGLMIGLSGCQAEASKDARANTGLRIVGSSTAYPFATKVAQEYSNVSGQNIIVEATGSGGGHKLFCESDAADTPSIVTSSRRQKPSEFALCQQNGVTDIIEVKIGSDGIVFATTVDGPDLDIGTKDIFRALAKNLPRSETDCTPVKNPFQSWNAVNPNLPKFRIETYGPPPTSGTRDAFVEIAMERGARQIACLNVLAESQPDAFKRISHILREDGRWIDGGENDTALVQTLVNTPSAIGIFGFSFLDQNIDKIKGAKIDGVAPHFENIANGRYPVSRSLYIYLKVEHAKRVPAVLGYALEFTSDSAVGPGGYLETLGLVPVTKEERAQIRNDIKALTPYQPESAETKPR